MRLIDADVLIKRLWEQHQGILNNAELYSNADEVVEEVCNLVSIVDEQPAAYDVESVVDKLDDKIEITWKHDYMGGRKDAFKEAIDIVKKGVVE